LEEARADDEVARKILQLRTQAGLSQRELAKLVGTTASVICRLEDADYEGHSLPLLRRIAAALDRRGLRFVSCPFGTGRHNLASMVLQPCDCHLQAAKDEGEAGFRLS
jgi:transcriptional regulator with XRE-family HTH domain